MVTRTGRRIIIYLLRIMHEAVAQVAVNGVSASKVIFSLRLR